MITLQTSILLAATSMPVNLAPEHRPLPADTPIVETDERGDDLRLRARLRSSGRASGNADYRERETRVGLVRRLKVEIEDARPNKRYAVRIDGVVLARVTTDRFGFAERHFRTVTDNPGGPTDLPRIGSGTQVSVGPVSGTLRRR